MNTVIINNEIKPPSIISDKTDHKNTVDVRLTYTEKLCKNFRQKCLVIPQISKTMHSDYISQIAE